jgi:hypothetical protein
MKSKLILTLSLCLLGIAALSRPASAQRPAYAKARGDANNFYSGQTYGSHATDHARLLNQYSATGQPVPKAVLQEHSAAIRTNVEAAKKSFANLGEKVNKDPAAAKALAEVEKHQAKVLEMCSMLDAECAKAEGDATMICSCCTDIEKELKAAAAAEHELSKQLKIEPLAASKE